MKDSLRTSIHDSFAILDDKLSILAKRYEVSTSKGVFPYSYSYSYSFSYSYSYSFANVNTLCRLNTIY
jgi:hypothetical protein